MGQRPIAIRVKLDSAIGSKNTAELGSLDANHAGSGPRDVSVEGCVNPDGRDKSVPGCSVSEAARRLGVSERTVFRLLKTGQLERITSKDDDQSPRLSDVINANNDTPMSDKNKSKADVPRSRFHQLSASMSDMNEIMNDKNVIFKILNDQIREKDIQISHMLHSQQEMAQTIQRLQEQMFELAHLVLTHNAAAAQAKAESEIKAQEQASRRGLSNLLGARNRK